MYLVTGGAGFIGSNLVQALVEKGQPVRVLDNFSTGSRQNLAGFLSDIELVEGDLRSLEEVRQAMQGVTHVLHQGALPSVPLSLEDPIDTHANNVMGTLNVLVAARDASVSRLVFASSCAVYGDGPESPKTEDLPPAPGSPYALQKWTAEAYCRQFTQLFGLETVCLRYFNVYGRRQDPQGPYAAVIPRFIEAFEQGKAPVVYGDGEQTRDFVHVSDVVGANLLALKAPDAPGRVFNVAAGKATSVLALVGHLAELFDTALQPRFATSRQGEVRHSVADVRQARRALNFEAKVTIVRGLERYAAWRKKKDCNE